MYKGLFLLIIIDVVFLSVKLVLLQMIFLFILLKKTYHDMFQNDIILIVEQHKI